MLKALKAFRFFKLFRVWRVGQFLGKIFRRFDINPAVILGMKMFAGFFVVTHGLSCFLFYIGTLTDLFKACDQFHECHENSLSASCNMLRWSQPICPCKPGNATSWCNSRTWLTETYFMMPVNRSVRAMDADVTNQYWITLYWVITTMTTIGFGDIKPQTQYEIWTCILCQIIGAAAFGFIVGNMTNIAQLLNGRKEKLTGEIDELNLLLRHFKAPRDLQRHATKLVRHQFHKPVKLIKRDIIDRVPTWIAVDIAKEAFRNVLHRCKLFGQASDHVLDKLYLRLQPVTLVPGEYLFRARDRSRALIFVLNGTVHIVDNDPSAKSAERTLRRQRTSWYAGATSPQNAAKDDVVSSILSGGFLGENSLICGLDFFEYSARAQRTCDLLYLPARDIIQAFEDSQDLAKIRVRCQLRQSRFLCLIKLTRILRHTKKENSHALAKFKGSHLSLQAHVQIVSSDAEITGASSGSATMIVQPECQIEGASLKNGGQAMPSADDRCQLGEPHLQLNKEKAPAVESVESISSGQNISFKILTPLSNVESSHFVIAGHHLSLQNLDSQTRDCIVQYCEMRGGKHEIDIGDFIGNSAISADSEILNQADSTAAKEDPDVSIGTALENLSLGSEDSHDVSLIELRLKAIFKKIRDVENVLCYNAQYSSES